MNEKLKITNIEEFEDYRKKYIVVNPHILFMQYLAVLFPNLILREESLAENIESNSNKFDVSSYNNINNKNLRDKTISKNTFIQYLGIQDLISERIFKYIDKKLVIGSMSFLSINANIGHEQSRRDRKTLQCELLCYAPYHPEGIQTDVPSETRSHHQYGFHSRY